MKLFYDFRAHLFSPYKRSFYVVSPEIFLRNFIIYIVKLLIVYLSFFKTTIYGSSFFANFKGYILVQCGKLTKNLFSFLFNKRICKYILKKSFPHAFIIIPLNQRSLWFLHLFHNLQNHFLRIGFKDTFKSLNKFKVFSAKVFTPSENPCGIYFIFCSCCKLCYTVQTRWPQMLVRMSIDSTIKRILCGIHTTFSYLTLR